MKKEIKYYNVTHNMSIVAENRLLQIKRLAKIREISINESADLLNSISEELKYTIPESRIYELRKILNPVGIGVVIGLEGKRRYVRKNNISGAELKQMTDSTYPIETPVIEKVIEEPKDNGISINNLPDIKKGLKFTFIRFSRNPSSIYEILEVSENNKRITFKNVSQPNLVSSRSFEDFYTQIKSFSWEIVDPTENQLKFLNSIDNVVSAKILKETVNTKNMFPTFKVQFSGSSSYIIAGGTGNCQLSIMSYANTLINKSSNLRQQLREIRLVSSRPLLLLDIKDSVYERLFIALKDGFLKECIISNTPYRSSNGSNMITLIINLDILYNGK